MLSSGWNTTGRTRTCDMPILKCPLDGRTTMPEWERWFPPGTVTYWNPVRKEYVRKMDGREIGWWVDEETWWVDKEFWYGSVARAGD